MRTGLAPHYHPRCFFQLAGFLGLDQRIRHFRTSEIPIDLMLLLLCLVSGSYGRTYPRRLRKGTLIVGVPPLWGQD